MFLAGKWIYTRGGSGPALSNTVQNQGPTGASAAVHGGPLDLTSPEEQATNAAI